MLYRRSLAALTALMLTTTGAAAFDDAKYPDWKGEWSRTGSLAWDPTKPRGLGQQAPLTAQYQAVLEASVADQKRGGQGNYTGNRCLPYGMPGGMLPYRPMEFIITPAITYVMLEHLTGHRWIYTDGRSWPKRSTLTFNGYSIGRWVDADGDGRYDTLLVETRALRGPRSFDSSGLPLHSDNETIVEERLTLDKTDPNLLHNEITTIDHALTRPWTVTRSYRRERNPSWFEHLCEVNNDVEIGNEYYFIGVDGYLMPTRKDQPPPKLRGFD
ncbi:MAG TPA: hypothetical protein VH684_11370 [Xanthobacteraceae bacterium]|jgi:hypothetical protein